jgi:TolB-like protein/class 3 adenylate cyclase/Flp pilus assembly protein TadD
MDTLGDTQENGQQGERKLAAIMFTDMVGYSTLSQENEELALKLLDRHQQIVRSILPKYSGREIETAGDSFFVEFHSAVEAANCAIEIQTTLHKRNQNRELEEQIKLRIGLHLGDVVQVDDRLHGDGVNIAARLEPLAATEGICLSEDFAHAVQNKLKYPLAKKSKVSLKNISEPMEIFCIQLPWVDEKTIKLKKKLSKKRILTIAIPALLILAGILYLLSSFATYKDIQKRIAVLPFHNIGGDTNDEFFAEGMTEQLISSLSNLSELNVIARSSVMKYKDSERDIKQIGKELKVGTILEGSIRKSQDKARITVQLIDVNTQESLWAMDYDKEVQDIFELQSEIAQNIVQQLQVQLKTEELQRLGVGESVNKAGYTSYLLGKFNLNRSTLDGFSKSISYFEDALKFGGEFAKTYTGLADAYTLMSLSGNSSIPMSETITKAKENVMKALGLDENLGEAHASLAYIHFKLEWNFEEAEKEFQKAIELSPGCAKAHEWYAEYLMVRARFDEALERMDNAYQLDPLSSKVNYGLGKIYFYTNELESAISWFENAIDLDPAFARSYSALGQTYILIEEFKKGITMMRKAVDLSNRNPIILAQLAYAYANSGQIKKTVRILQEFSDRANNEDIASINYVPIYIGLADFDKAFALLNKSYEERNGLLLFVKAEPIFEELRDDSRYDKLVEKIGL